MTPYRTFFGDAEYDFALPPNLIIELERKTGVGIGLLGKRMFGLEFAHADILETIRLALIGGGTEPQRALELLNTYAVGRPILEIYNIAVAILDRVMNGEPNPKDESDNGQA